MKMKDVKGLTENEFEICEILGIIIKTMEMMSVTGEQTPYFIRHEVSKAADKLKLLRERGK